MIRLLPLIISALCCASCVNPQGASENAAEDRIMLVRAIPATLGHKRVVYQSENHRDFAQFIERNGEPDFIAETSSGDRRYMILYYMAKRQAFACRTWDGYKNEINFAGPYQITDKESALLDELRSKSDTGYAAERFVAPRHEHGAPYFTALFKEPR